jgi:hypothetical protein
LKLQVRKRIGLVVVESRTKRSVWRSTLQRSDVLEDARIAKKRADGVAQAIECLPSKREALSSNPSTEKKKKV